MTFGEHITALHKCKGFSQGVQDKAVGTSGDTIDRYERIEVKPSIEVAAKIADPLEVSLDYLVGKNLRGSGCKNPKAAAGHSKAQ